MTQEEKDELPLPQGCENWSETRKKDREAMAAAIGRLCAHHGINYIIESNYRGDPARMIVRIEDLKTGLAANPTIGGRGGKNTFLFSWHFNQTNDLIIDPGFTQDINPYHHRKATDVAWGFENLMQLLDNRLRCMAEGKATIARACW